VVQLRSRVYEISEGFRRLEIQNTQLQEENEALRREINDLREALGQHRTSRRPTSGVYRLLNVQHSMLAVIRSDRDREPLLAGTDDGNRTTAAQTQV
jgi:regulator of replication initiation timing